MGSQKSTKLLLVIQSTHYCAEFQAGRHTGNPLVRRRDRTDPELRRLVLRRRAPEELQYQRHQSITLTRRQLERPRPSQRRLGAGAQLLAEIRLHLRECPTRPHLQILLHVGGGGRHSLDLPAAVPARRPDVQHRAAASRDAAAAASLHRRRLHSFRQQESKNLCQVEFEVAMGSFAGAPELHQTKTPHDLQGPRATLSERI